jgi:hypothetical protein
MSYGFNSIQLTPPDATDWAREATAAYGRSLTDQRAVDTPESPKKLRSYEVRNMHGQVWRRAGSSRGRI